MEIEGVLKLVFFLLSVHAIGTSLVLGKHPAASPQTEAPSCVQGPQAHRKYACYFFSSLDSRS